MVTENVSKYRSFYRRVQYHEANSGQGGSRVRTDPRYQNLHDDLRELNGVGVATDYTLSVVCNARKRGPVTLGAEGESLGPHKVKYSTRLAEFKSFDTTVSKLILEFEGDEEGDGPEQLVPVYVVLQP